MALALHLPGSRLSSLFLVDDGAAINVASTMVSWLRLVSIEQTLLLAPRSIRSTQEARDRRFWKLLFPLAMERPTVLEQVRFQRRGAVLTQHRGQPTLLRSTSHEDRSVHQSLDWSEGFQSLRSSVAKPRGSVAGAGAAGYPVRLCLRFLSEFLDGKSEPTPHPKGGESSFPSRPDARNGLRHRTRCRQVRRVPCVRQDAQ